MALLSSLLSLPAADDVWSTGRDTSRLQVIDCDLLTPLEGTAFLPRWDSQDTCLDMRAGRPSWINVCAEAHAYETSTALPEQWQLEARDHFASWISRGKSRLILQDPASHEVMSLGLSRLFCSDEDIETLAD
jgi:hypothetical protein